MNGLMGSRFTVKEEEGYGGEHLFLFFIFAFPVPFAPRISSPSSSPSLTALTSSKNCHGKWVSSETILGSMQINALAGGMVSFWEIAREAFCFKWAKRRVFRDNDEMHH